MSKPYQAPSQQSIDALAAAIVGFVVELAQAIFSFDPEHTRRRLHRAIQRAERAVEVMLLLMALRLAGPPPKSNVLISRRNTPRGFSRRTKRSKLVFKFARVRLRHGNFYLRIVRLIEAMVQPMRYVRRFLKRLCKGLRGSRLVAARPTAHALCADAPLSASYANSS